VVNDDDLKPPARRTVLPPPPIPSLDNAEEEEEDDEEEEWGAVVEIIPPTKEEMSLMMKAFTNMSSTSNDMLPNTVLADKLISVIKRKFKVWDVTLSLKDPCTNLQMTSNGVAIVNTWVCSGNEHVTFDPNDMRRPIANLARSQVLAAGFRKYGDDQIRVCLPWL
jgi:hypothetical protein